MKIAGGAILAPEVIFECQGTASLEALIAAGTREGPGR